MFDIQHRHTVARGRKKRKDFCRKNPEYSDFFEKSEENASVAEPAVFAQEKAQ